MQEGGWKGPDIKQGHQQDNQFELMEDYLWQTLINLSNDQCAVVQTVWNFNRIALSYLRIQRKISDKPKVKFHHLQSNLGARPKY